MGALYSSPAFFSEPQESFFELRERLVECKFDEMSLNITKIYHVFGRTQDKLTLEEARVAQVRSNSGLASGACFGTEAGRAGEWVAE